jgi:hypothetical protein
MAPLGQTIAVIDKSGKVVSTVSYSLARQSRYKSLVTLLSNHQKVPVFF